MSSTNHTRRWTALLGLTLVLAAGQAAAVEFEPLLRLRSTTSLAEVGGTLFAGTDGGGLVLRPADAPGQARRWVGGREIAGSIVSDLAWTGRHLWVATEGSGMTRVSDPAGAAAFRQYAGNLGSLDLTAVGGAVVVGVERVWYGMDGAGVGVITNGIAGLTYNAAQDGLVSDDVRAIAVREEAVFFGTPAGVSRFADNVFTTVNAGLTGTGVSCFLEDADGSLLAGGNGGVFRWDEDGGAWTALPAVGFRVDDLALQSGRIHALGTGGLVRFNGTTWDELVLPLEGARALAGGQGLWVGGSLRVDGMAPSSGYAWQGRQQEAGGFETWVMDNSSLIFNAEAVTFGADGRPWMGSWAATGMSAVDDGQWRNIFALAAADNDSSGLINHSGNLLAMATDSEGVIWACQYGSGGLLRHDPRTGRTEQVLTTNSGLGSRGIVNLVAHPDGPLLVLFDWMGTAKVQVLVDPAAWRGDANWVDLPSGAPGLGDGATVWDALVERSDVIWFGVQTTGLVRWDLNGNEAGPDDPLTWFDPTDDRWDDPLTEVGSHSMADPFGLDLADDGTIWVGGNGLVRFTCTVYPSGLGVEVETSLFRKSSPLLPGLLDGQVTDVAVGGDGHLWVATRSGLNQVRLAGDETEVEAWTDLANYVGNEDFAALYSPAIIAPLPGFVYRRIVADPGSRRLLLSGDRGVALIEPGGTTGGGADVLAAAYLYPSPFRPGSSDALLGVGGLDLSRDDPADVAIYNLEGQLVYRDQEVGSAQGFWRGVNRQGSAVASGMYIVRVTWRGQTTVRTLGVER